MNTESEVLECGCERCFINGKCHWIFCDEHDEYDNFLKFQHLGKLYIKLDD